MRDTFEEAYQAVINCNFANEMKIVAESMIWFTIPLWLIPYAIVRKIKEIYNGN